MWSVYCQFFLDEKELLGELQVSFICFLVGHGMYVCTHVVKGGRASSYW